MTPEIGLLRRPSWALAPAKAAHRLSSSERTMLRECARRYVRTATGVHDLRMAAHLRGVRIHAGNAIAMLINPSTGGSAKLTAAVKNAASHIGLPTKPMPPEISRLLSPGSASCTPVRLSSTDPLFTERRDELVSLAARYAVPQGSGVLWTLPQKPKEDQRGRSINATGYPRFSNGNSSAS